MVHGNVLATAAVLLLAATPASFAQAKDPYVGVWTLDTTSPAVDNRPTAATLTITEAGNGVRVEVRETYKDRPEQVWSFQSGGDSQDTPVTGLASIDSVSTTSNGERSKTSVFKKAGKVVSESTADVSEDGTMLTITTKGVGPSGEPVSRTSVYRRQPS